MSASLELTHSNADDFPYKNSDPNMIRDITRRFINLFSYESQFMQKRYRIVNAPDLAPNDLIFAPKRSPCIMILRAEDYDKYNLISDYFIEAIRIRTYRGDDVAHESAYDYWVTNRTKIMAHCNAAHHVHDARICAREMIYENKMEVGTFRPTVAIGVIQLMRDVLGEKCEYILNPCAGWGDRLIGFMAARGIRAVIDIDPNRELGPKYDAIEKWARPKLRESFSREYFDRPYEDIDDQELLDALIRNIHSNGNIRFDLALIAPPYFDLEVYVPDDPAQSIVRYNTFERWFNNFLIPSIMKCGRLVRVGGIVALVINQAPVARRNRNAQFLRRMIRAVSRNESMKYLGVISYAEVRGEQLRSPQPIWFWQRVSN
jgi:hypothetical protein